MSGLLVGLQANSEDSLSLQETQRLGRLWWSSAPESPEHIEAETLMDGGAVDEKRAKRSWRT